MFLKSDFDGPRQLPGYREFLRSALVSGLSFILDFFLCMLIVEKSTLGYLPATSISFTLGTVLNYALSVLWIFGRANKGKRHLEFVAFLGLAGIGLVLNAFAMVFFTSICSFHYLVSRVVSATLVFFFNFSSRKFIIFRAGRKKGTASKNFSPD